MDMNKSFLNDALSGREDANAKDEHGRTAMMLAAWKGLADADGGAMAQRADMLVMEAC